MKDLIGSRMTHNMPGLWNEDIMDRDFVMRESDEEVRRG